jgi:hypothetical protein
MASLLAKHCPAVSGQGAQGAFELIAFSSKREERVSVPIICGIPHQRLHVFPLSERAELPCQLSADRSGMWQGDFAWLDSFRRLPRQDEKHGASITPSCAPVC